MVFALFFHAPTLLLQCLVFTEPFEGILFLPLVARPVMSIAWVHAKSTLPKSQVCWFAERQSRAESQQKWLESPFSSELKSTLKVLTGIECYAIPPLSESFPACSLSQGLLSKFHHHLSTKGLLKTQPPTNRSWKSFLTPGSINSPLNFGDIRDQLRHMFVIYICR